ncbi:MAG: A24 family peptidase [Thermoguttaceae bacterium]
MNEILTVPLTVRLVAVFIFGAFAGAAANWAIYRLAWFARPISPWSPPAPAAPRRRWSDRLPILGWMGLRRESFLHGRGFWLRPMLIEILMGGGLAALYWWETVAPGLLPRGGLLPDAVLHAEFAVHALLITLMLAASLIDADEMIIPDEITVGGTLVALLLAAAWPQSLLPNPIAGPGFLELSSPDAWPDWLAGGRVGALAIGLGCWWLWCVAIMPRSWYPRHGWLRAVRLCCARLTRERATYRILRMAAFGSLAVLLVWYRAGTNWEGLLSALVGMAAGGGLIWLVRVIGAAALGREAMGFGDVTLMAMIGAFLGWQPCLVIFFLAPVAGLVVGLLRLLLLRDREIPYGPFLCLAALFVIVFWNAVWTWSQGIFAMGWLVPVVMLFCLLLMAVMLTVWRLLLSLLR